MLNIPARCLLYDAAYSQSSIVNCQFHRKETAIEKLNALSQNQSLPKTQGKPFLLPMTFFMTERQHAMITAAFDKADTEHADGPRSGKGLADLCRMAEDYLSNDGV
jgi:hypothetical protein